MARNASSAYQPDAGDFVYLDFSPHAGTEQAGRRPGLVLSPRNFNVATGLVFVCPVTSQMKGGSFEVPVPAGLKMKGVVLAAHLRSLDWLQRRAEFHAAAPRPLMLEVLARVEAILKIDLG